MVTVIVSKFWLWSNFLGMIGCAAYVVWSKHKQIGWWASALWFWLLLSSLFIFQAPFALFPALSHMVNQTSGQAFSQVLLMPLAVLAIPKKHFRQALRYLTAGFVAFEVLALLFFGYGLLDANSFDGAWIASMLPLATPWLGLAGFATICVTRGATAWFVMGTQFAVLYASLQKSTKRLCLPLIPLFLAGAAISQGGKLVSSTGRVAMWEQYAKWWVDAGSWVWSVGTGVGTFHWLGPFIQNLQGELYMQAHNDWLQVTFEAGVIGFALSLAFFLRLAWLARRTPRVLAAWLGVGVFCVTYHPTHFFASAFWLLLLARAVLEIPQLEYNQAGGPTYAERLFGCRVSGAVESGPVPSGHHPV